MAKKRPQLDKLSKGTTGKATLNRGSKKTSYVGVGIPTLVAAAKGLRAVGKKGK